MSTQWHVLFYAAVTEHGSPATEALAEVLLTKEPQQGDVLLIRRHGPPGAADAAARTLRHLWPLVVHEALIELKSPSRPPRAGDLIKLIGYGAQLHRLRLHEIGAFENLLLCLVATTTTAALQQEVQALGAIVSQVAPGYKLLAPRPYAILLVDLADVVAAEADE